MTLRGLSPRLRGNRAAGRGGAGRQGTIPAPAGKPWWTAARAPERRDYPRACGETDHVPRQPGITRGLSPRLRGNHCVKREHAPCSGTIPAPAGKPSPDRRRPAAYWDYPRACGETPRRRPTRSTSGGLSPRLRGNRRVVGERRDTGGTIPAPAGKPCRRKRRARPSRDYPRACGETAFVRRRFRFGSGLSPRLRGNRTGTVVFSSRYGTIPAPAGKPAK